MIWELKITEYNNELTKYVSINLGNGRDKVLNVYDIILIEKISKLDILIVTKGGEYKVRATLKNLQKLLDDKLFYRSHRSYIINVSQIDKILKMGNYYEVIFYYVKSKALITRENKVGLKNEQILLSI